MITTEQYINNLKVDKENLISILKNKNIQISNDKTFTTIIPEVNKILSYNEIVNSYFNTNIEGGGIWNPGWTKSLKKLPVFEFNGTSAKKLFHYYPFDEIDLSKINFNTITSAEGMFQASYLKNIDLSKYDTNNIINMQDMFRGCATLEWNEDHFKNLVSNKCANISYLFYGCDAFNNAKLIHFPNWDTSNVTNFTSCLSSINEGSSTFPDFDLSNWDMGKALNIGDMFSNGYTPRITNIKFGYNIGKAENISSGPAATYTRYLSHDSLMTLINGLYDRAAAGYTRTATVRLHADNKAKLSDEEIAIATNKGWIVS